LKIACSSWTFDIPIKAGKLSLVGFIEEAGRIPGLEAVELLDRHFTSTDDAYLDSLRAAAEKSGLKVAAVAICASYGFGDEAARRSGLEHVKRFARACKRLDAPCARVTTGLYRKPDADYEAQKAWVLDSLKAATKIAAELDLLFALENHDSVCKTADEVLWLVNSVGSRHFGACPDPSNFAPPSDPNADKELIYAGAEKLAPKSYHAHAKFTTFADNGEDNYLDYRRLMAIYRNAGYERYQSIEYRCEDPFTGARKAVGLLAKHIGGMRAAGERLLLLTVKGGVKVLTFQRRDLGMGMSVDAFISELRQAVGEEAKPRVVLNLENVAYISSGPMGALIGLCKRVRAAGGEICFCALSPYVFDAFRVTKLHQVFEFHPSEEEAIQALGK